MDAILRRLRREASEFTGAEADRFAHFRTVIERCTPSLLQVMTYVKHRAFDEEKEWRFISPPILNGDMRVQFRVGKTTLIPYVNFDLLGSADDVFQLAEVIVGPSPTEELSRESIYALLVRHNAVARLGITLSNIPYREL